MVAALCIMAGAVFAQRDNISGPPTASEDFAGILQGIADFVTTFGIPVAAAFIMLTGFMFVAAQGNAQKLAEARSMLLWVLVGTAIIVGAGPIASMIIDFAQDL